MAKRPLRQAEQTWDNLDEAMARIEMAKDDLDLRGLGLSELPESISQLTQLRFLVLSNNHLTKLPEFIGRLTRLKQLLLQNNQVTELPDSIGQLVRLQRLILSNNRLAELPESIGQLTQLNTLSLHNNQSWIQLVSATFELGQ